MAIKLLKIIKITAGGFHSWVEADIRGEVVRIRKPNNAVARLLKSMQIEVEPIYVPQAVASDFQGTSYGDMEIRDERSWWQKLVSWFKSLFGKEKTS